MRAGRLLGKGSLSCSLTRSPSRLARQARIRNLITAIVIDLGEIRDIHYGNLRILTQSRMQEEGRKEDDVDERTSSAKVEGPPNERR